MCLPFLEVLHAFAAATFVVGPAEPYFLSTERATKADVEIFNVPPRQEQNGNHKKDAIYCHYEAGGSKG